MSRVGQDEDSFLGKKFLSRKALTTSRLLYVQFFLFFRFVFDGKLGTRLFSLLLLCGSRLDLQSIMINRNVNLLADLDLAFNN